MKYIQIALADDHGLFRKGMVALIDRLPGYKVTLEAENGQDLISKISSKNKPDIVLLDLSMPKMDGLATAAWIKDNHPGMKIIVLSMHNEPAKVIPVIKLGIKGYLLKDAQPSEFEEALRTVAAGDEYFPRFILKYLLGNLNPVQVPEDKLNMREIEFLKLAGTELTYKEIAEKMCVSQRTIRWLPRPVI